MSKSNLALVPPMEEEFVSAAAVVETPKYQQQQQTPRYASEAEEKIAFRQQQMDGYGGW